MTDGRAGDELCSTSSYFPLKLLFQKKEFRYLLKLSLKLLLFSFSSFFLWWGGEGGLFVCLGVY